jgi:hypothetical protein
MLMRISNHSFSIAFRMRNKPKTRSVYWYICSKKENFRPRNNPCDKSNIWRAAAWKACACTAPPWPKSLTLFSSSTMVLSAPPSLSGAADHPAAQRTEREREREREGCAPSKLFSFFRRNARRLPNIRRRSWRAQKINIVSNEAKNSYLLSFSHTQRARE